MEGTRLGGYFFGTAAKSGWVRWLEEVAVGCEWGFRVAAERGARRRGMQGGFRGNCLRKVSVEVKFIV